MNHVTWSSFVLQISHAQNAAKDSQMIAMEKEWIARAILNNREKLIKNYKDKNLYQKEFRHYFLWVCGCCLDMILNHTRRLFKKA